jgi:hypothetical protein
MFQWSQTCGNNNVRFGYRQRGSFHVFPVKLREDIRGFRKKKDTRTIGAFLTVLP